MDAERSSLCNFFVNFLMEENYLLTAFELLHELLDDGRDAQAIRLKEFFSDPSRFSPDQISRYNSIRVADPQSLLEEKEALAEKLAISEYEFRLAQEDITRLKTEGQKKSDHIDKSKELDSDEFEDNRPEIQRKKKDFSFTDIGPLKNNERQDLNCAVKEYLLLAGYRLTAMTFYEEVTDQNLDVWQDSPAHVPDALRYYYYQYLSSTSEAAEEKIAMLQENDSLKKEIERLNKEKDGLLKSKEDFEEQISAFNKSTESLQKDLRDREKQVQSLKQSSEHQRMILNDCRAEITSLKMHIEGSRAGQYMSANEGDPVKLQSKDNGEEQLSSLPEEVEKPIVEKDGGLVYESSISAEKGHIQTEDDLVVEEVKNIIADQREVTAEASNSTLQNQKEVSNYLLSPSNGSFPPGDLGSILKVDPGIGRGSNSKSDKANGEADSEEMGLGTIQILADALPKIVPYVLINHREELLPLMMCAIERHPVSSTRDSLTHTLFNLIKRPDEQQRRIIMDACVSLSRNVGEMRTETELLPQCWEQINHTYEERRLLVAQSCGELAEYVRPEIRDSLILSIVQQLIEDSATVVREAAAHNLALLLPLFPNTDKYFKVEEMMFQLICDPSGLVVETTLKELLPAVIKWGNRLDHILRVLLSHTLSSAQHCPPLSGVEGSLESHLRVLGERERWNIDVLLRMLMELLPAIHQKSMATCPFSSISKSEESAFSVSLLETYAEGRSEWPMFEWMHVDCFANLLQLACMLPQKEDHLRNRITKFLLAVSELFGSSYLAHIELPVFLVAVGDDEADLQFLPSAIHPRIKGLKPRTAVANRLATLCILPLLLAGVLGAPSKHDELTIFLRQLLVESKTKENQSSKHNNEVLDAVRFLCTFPEHHSMIFGILWEMVVDSTAELKINAAKLLKTIVPYIDAKVASANVLPALITLGSDQNLNVKYASIDAFGSVAQHFKVDMIVDKILVQMDAFLEDGSHEAIIAVIRALLVAIPHTTERLRDYLLSKILQLSASPSSSTDVNRRRERANAFCEAIRALDATDLSQTSVREYLLPAIQNLLKDPDALDPAHKEALEIIMKERSGGTFEAISKAMGAHLGIASSVTSLFGEGGLLGKKEAMETTAIAPSSPTLQGPESPKVTAAATEDTRFRRIMKGNFTEMLRSKAKNQDETQPQNH
ncbi:PREDICTED: lisH domain and HEAT repeat-containing protein KIAA1468 homolog [Camelina sativa]|uniref:LisH domain and HEAT repeat-containing protein KIAA1468 homolog n=1 Tax=Camelina sativa TaxID=90675 RepID=A0ABM0VBL1_CAMSA|nr:PREDICTED: lisH domain and HEAT repeat-containing protein KIAA1468 homolog [Camelina sativa]